MPVESYEKGEEKRCPICGAPYYAECEHMKHPEKFVEIMDKAVEVPIGSKKAKVLEGTPEELDKAIDEAFNRIMTKEVEVPLGSEESKVLEGTREELDKEVERAFERITENDRSLVERIIKEAVEENIKLDAIQQFLEFEKKQGQLSPQIKKVKPFREVLIESILRVLPNIKSGFKNQEDFERQLKKAVVNKIVAKAEIGFFRIGPRQ